MNHRLTPAQIQAFTGLMHATSVGNVFSLWSEDALGKTTVLQAVQRGIGGAMLTLSDFVAAIDNRHPLAVEESFFQLVMDALRAHSSVIVDDLGLIINVTNGCGSYPRSGLLDAPLNVLAEFAVENGKKLIVGNGNTPTLTKYGYAFSIGGFKVDDYRCLSEIYLGAELTGQLDFEKIFRFAPNLNAHQLKASCLWLKREPELDTDRFIDYLRSQYLTSNVDLAEVRQVTLRDLKGIDDIIQSLEANIAMPLENDALAAELQLKPKRGVLLAGPPGTGKTTIGRALAHRLKSKFFLVDGTFIAGTQQFYGSIHRVFEQAKHNAPSVIFIDDSDAIFESGEELGLYRYLLTMLDGLESESAGRVCVMMTAMDVSNLPPALIRSGRIELWLETRLPNADARTMIMEAQLKPVREALGDVDVAKLADATEGLTGADLKRLIEDGKTLLAFDRLHKVPARPATEYFLTALETLRQNKNRYAEAEASSRKQKPPRAGYFTMPDDDNDRRGIGFHCR